MVLTIALLRWLVLNDYGLGSLSWLVMPWLCHQPPNIGDRVLECEVWGVTYECLVLPKFTVYVLLLYIVIEIVLYGNSIYQESRIYTGGKSDALLEIIFGRQIRDTQLHVYRSNCSLITHTTTYVRWCWQFYIIDQEAAGFHPEPITLMKKSIDTAHVQKNLNDKYVIHNCMFLGLTALSSHILRHTFAGADSLT